MEQREPLTIEDMDEVGDLFGLRYDGELVELYIEDDEQFFYKCTFHKFWVQDLLAVVKEADRKIGVVILKHE